jgi:3',5'-cyclic AMP phosphodiesterase CpdA
MLYLGDMVNGVKLENLKPEIEELKEEVIDKLPFKVYPCIGNHENKQRQGSPEYNKAYIDTFGKDRIDYVFQQGKIQFVVFDNSGMPPRPSIKMEKEHEELRKQKLIWLRKVFEANPEKNKILCCHIPLACVREEEVLAKSFGFPSYYVHDEEMLALLREYNDSVLAVLSGHLHLTGMKKIDGIHHIVASGLASYPHDFGIYYVYRDRIDVRMRSVPESMHEPYASNIHNRRRHGIDYTNKAHPTHEQYVKGNADERAFSIPFKIL